MSLRELVGGARAQLARRMAHAAGRLARQVFIQLDYPPSAADMPRYGYGRASNRRLHALIAARQNTYHEALTTIAGFAEDLRRIEARARDPREPSWVNDWIPGLDSAAIYGFLRARSPRLFLEIDSGNSTLFAGRARRDGQLDTAIVSIDPLPRVSIEGIADEIVRQPLESVDLTLFKRLAPRDVLFLDGSHRAFMNSDVAAFFLDILPELPKGVLVGIHDIFLPDDYPPEIAYRYYSEQYILASYLLGADGNVEIVLPASFISRSNEFADAVDRFWIETRVNPGERHGTAFWFNA